ncbi:uncharacterized protein ColSpa_09832 [Colletotrichum spaethianum]|uniref:Uncharacterized protein n=1 Tax=Colletotrichum spaethianum TaxID=700344 RepID=A0AA37UK86_9PEZI|nr:uncharacterized protein ColSpa_09832 [Colletotrichum spaethianum]GKT49651.1 hypothetical protein ColSpa_09832 [Colletotrichum spaethianum]
MPPKIASRSSEEALEGYDFVKMRLADLQQYSRRLTLGAIPALPTLPTLPTISAISTIPTTVVDSQE